MEVPVVLTCPGTIPGSWGDVVIRRRALGPESCPTDELTAVSAQVRIKSQTRTFCNHLIIHHLESPYQRRHLNFCHGTI
jgi:hypothetical protein